ncbi:MAG: CoA transferase [Deltaproteobacteria bacterium]|nr:CoA transferase [Deltaproteobacteria bacterium]MBW2445513.1 CoA transferase [Deltaproteobacteria bacterium]
MLSPYRVLDLTNEDGILCGQILADLGADVIQIEPPGGSSARRVGPWRREGPAVERSLFFAAYARNKRSAVLDLGADADRERFSSWVAGADFLIESERPGRMAEFGFGHEDLLRIQPGLVHVSITPFGQDGPKAGWAATDLTSMAAGGFAYLSGNADGPPTRVSVPQAHAQAGADAAIGALVAHAERVRTGRGQHVDVSLQQSVTLAMMFRTLDDAVGMAPAQRVGSGIQAGGVLVPTRHRARDGWVTLGPSILPSTGHFMRRLLEWVAEEGGCDPALAEQEWGSFGIRLGAGKLPPDAYDPVARVLDEFFATRTKADVMRAAVERRLLVAPALTLGEMLASEQLVEREFLVPLEPDGNPLARAPGPFARFGASPIRHRLPPPQLDEHGPELQAEPVRRPAPAGIPPDADDGSLPLAGVKILDLFWVLAGPTATRTLADYGATVIRVESSQRLDTLRVSPPWQFGAPHPESGVGFQSANANKLGITVDLGSEEGRDLVRELAGWADVVTESFAPGVMDSFGLGWEALRQGRPDLVMISSCIMGQTGPWRDYAGFGSLAVSITGFQELGSWPGRPPSGPFGAYTDAIASRYNALAILAALEHRRRTGEGQYIDLSQCEAALHFLAPAILDRTLHGSGPGAVGNDDGELFPHGMFPAAGDDRWVAIAVRDDRDWAALCEAIDRADLVPRREERAEVEAAIAAWTRERQPAEIETRLQAGNVPAHEALDTPGLFRDAQLQHRGHFIEMAHEVFQTTTVESSRLLLSRTPARTPKESLSLGRDNALVLEEILGLSAEQIADLTERGILS